MNQEQRNRMTEPDGRDPAQIQEEIASTRSEMDQTLSALQQQLSPDMLLDQARRYLSGSTGGGREFLTNLSESIKRNPAPTALIGAGIAWLMIRGYREQNGARAALPPQTNPQLAGGDTAVGGGRQEVRDTVQAAARDIAEREGLTLEDREARKQPPGSAMSRGLL